MDHQSRLNLTNNLLSRISIPERRPTGFDPLSANEDTLIKHGLPLAPDKKLYPSQHAMWENLVAQAITFIPPTFEVMDDAPVPEELATPQGKQGAKREGSRWSGAVVERGSSQKPFKKVEGSWIVPKAYPLTKAWTTWGWHNSSYKSGTWVGIDGYHTKASHVLQSGTAERCIVSPRQTTLHPTYAWVEWVPAFPIKFANFEVRSGDLITCIVESPDPKSARILLYNRSTCNYSGANLTMPEGGLPVEGKTVEWIVEGGNPHHKKSPDPLHEGSQNAWSDGTWNTPFLGATFIYDCSAETEDGKRTNLEHAFLVNQVQDGQLLNTAVKENDGMVGIFSAPTYPTWTQIAQVNQ